MRDYLPPLAKVKCSEGRLGNLLYTLRKTQSNAMHSGRSSLLLMVLAGKKKKKQPFIAHNPLCASCKVCQEGCPGLPSPLSLERTTLLHSVILWLLWLGPEFCLATLHLKESKAGEICTADGRNYLVHLTSEIFFFFLFLLSLSPFSTNYSKAG